MTAASREPGRPRRRSTWLVGWWKNGVTAGAWQCPSHRGGRTILAIANLVSLNRMRPVPSGDSEAWRLLPAAAPSFPTDGRTRPRADAGPCRGRSPAAQGARQRATPAHPLQPARRAAVVGELNHRLDLSQSALSQHLALLREMDSWTRAARRNHLLLAAGRAGRPRHGAAAGHLLHPQTRSPRAAKRPTRSATTDARATAMLFAWLGARSRSGSASDCWLGRSILTVPVLHYLVGQPEKLAIGGSLLVVGLVADGQRALCAESPGRLAQRALVRSAGMRARGRRNPGPLGTRTGAARAVRRRDAGRRMAHAARRRRGSRRPRAAARGGRRGRGGCRRPERARRRRRRFPDRAGRSSCWRAYRWRAP